VVGGKGPAAYAAALERIRQSLGLRDRVIFTGSLPDAKLAAHYATADLFLSLSEHEGFAIPLVEAMRAGIPVIAYAAGAVPETLSGAGVLLGTLEPYEVAEVVARLCNDDRMREGLLARQAERAAELVAFPRRQVVTRALADLLQG
jgi:glycosyltransferase involved in cell wall biosynthesis